MINMQVLQRSCLISMLGYLHICDALTTGGCGRPQNHRLLHLMHHCYAAASREAMTHHLGDPVSKIMIINDIYIICISTYAFGVTSESDL